MSKIQNIVLFEYEIHVEYCKEEYKMLAIFNLQSYVAHLSL